jgi:trimeric autotransporter adhesin
LTTLNTDRQAAERSNCKFKTAMTGKLTFVKRAALVLLLATLNSQFSIASAQGNSFTYQGRLTDSGSAYTGSAEFQATLWDVASGGAVLAVNSPASLIVGVTNGLFTLPLDFGANFPGAARWLQLEVRTTIGSFTTLSPRQPITPTPYAISAINLAGTLPVGQLSGTLLDSQLSGNVPRLNASQTFTGTQNFSPASGAPFIVNSSTVVANLNADLLDGLSSSDFWKATGNAGTTAGTHFLGTTDNQAVELKVNNVRALRLEPNTQGAPNVIGGAPSNFAAPGVVGATIGGGGAMNYFGSIYSNQVDADFGTVGGGARNAIQSDAINATISGGTRNIIQTNGQVATIGGGYNNTIQRNADAATVGGGWVNTIQSYAQYSAISGGANNTIQSTATFTTIGGGYQNTIQTNATYGTIGGGFSNTITSSYATIPGGTLNSATSFAFAAGRRAKANHTGSFVWADSQDADFLSDRVNQFKIRAAGGVSIVSQASGLTPAAMRIESTTANGVGIAVTQTSSDATSVFSNRGTGDIIRGFSGTSGQNLVFRVLNNGNVTITGTLSQGSDRNNKENFVEVDGRQILEKVAALPISIWNYKTEETRHIGPTAQDFRAAFGLGENETTIATVDTDGVALAAIQGLNQKLEEQRAENAELKQSVNELKELVGKLTEKWGGVQ